MRAISTKDIARRIATKAPLSAQQNRYLAILARGDADDCAYCGVELDDTNRTVDHVVPIAQHGNNHLDNLALACAPCNTSKANRTVEQWRGGVAQRQIVDGAVVPKTPKKKRHAIPPTPAPGHVDSHGVRNGRRIVLSTTQAETVRRGWDREQALERLRPMTDPLLDRPSTEATG